MTNPSVGAAAPAPRREPEELILVALLLLAALGVALTRVEGPTGHRYWMAMTPVFGVASAWAAAARAKQRGEALARVLRTQVLHWAGATGAVALVFVLERAGRFEREAPGYAALIVLALSCFVAGVHGDWRMMVLGLALGLAVIGLSVLQSLVWLVVVPMLLALAVATVLHLRRSASTNGGGA
jgi:hypothetical protein